MIQIDGSLSLCENIFCTFKEKYSLHNKKVINFLEFLTIKFGKDDLIVKRCRRAWLWRCIGGFDYGDEEEGVIVEKYRRVFLIFWNQSVFREILENFVNFRKKKKETESIKLIN